MSASASDSKSEAPPAYSSTRQATAPIVESNVPPPAYTFPRSFVIGTQVVDALVSPEQLKGHLALLRVFYTLRSTVEDAKDDRFPAWVKEMAPERRWSWFVTLAVHRFETWYKKASTGLTISSFLEDQLPPNDVVMVWHAYLLNPGWFSEDCERLPGLKDLRDQSGVFAESIARLGQIMAEEPSLSRVKSWSDKQTVAFDPLDAMSQLSHKTITCPQCRKQVDCPFYDDHGKGFCQQFSMACPHCKFEITKEALAVLKFAKVIVNDGTTASAYLAGTLYTPTDDLDLERAKAVKVAIMRSTHLKYPKDSTVLNWERNIQQGLKHSLPRLKAAAGLKMKSGGGRLLLRIMSAYTDDSPFSIDLVGAVLRQSSFVKKMHDLGWSDPTFFDSELDVVALQHSVARYHAFLDLMRSSPAEFFVPTLDIDLAWHTHQLMAEKYKRDCKIYVGRYVDHDDKIEENLLSSAFDITCRAWTARFNVPYMHCGCPLPGETIGLKLARLVGNSQQKPSFLVPPNDPDLLAGTHPSDHNAVFAFHHKKMSEGARKARQKKIEKRRQRDAELARKGKMSPENIERSRAHDAAFLMPVPLFFYGGFGGCAAYGGVVHGSCAAGAGGCAVGGTACGSGGGCAGGAAGGGCGGGGGGGGCGGGGCGGGGGGGCGGG